MWHCVAMNKPKIVAYLKPTCGWSQGVVTQNNITPDAPINQPCAHEMPQSSPLNFAVRR